jgi:hypothetical protein
MQEQGRGDDDNSAVSGLNSRKVLLSQLPEGYDLLMTGGWDIARQQHAHPVAYVVLVALLLLQVGYASHQHDHAIGEQTSSCAFCIQADQSAAIPVADHAEALPVVAQSSPRTAANDVSEATPASAYSARAPPSA